MDNISGMFINKAKELFKETFLKLDNNTDGYNTTLNATRNYNASMYDRVVTSLGLSALTYICLILGCIGSLIVKSQQQQDPNIHIDVITKDSAKNAPFIASAFLFGIFLLSKFISMNHIITFLTYYIIIYTMFSSYIIVEYILLQCINIPFDTFNLDVKIKNITKPLTHFKMKIKFTYLTLVSLPICCAICCLYIILDRHWIFNNIIATLIGIYAISYVHIQKLYYGIIMLSSLLVYDIFWVYGTNVMVTVATKMNAPVKFLFPNDFIVNGIHSTSHSLLGLGDVVIPGLYLALLLRYDYFTFPNRKPLFFICGLIFYGLGMIVTNIVLYIFKTGQPALLYLVPALFIGTFFTQCLFGKSTNDILNYDDANQFKNKSEKID